MCRHDFDVNDGEDKMVTLVVLLTGWGSPDSPQNKKSDRIFVFNKFSLQVIGGESGGV